MTRIENSLNTLPLSQSAHLALSQFKQLAKIKEDALTGAGLLYERALMRATPGASCHLLQCRDALLAINLPRLADWELLPAWLGPWVENPVIAPNDWTTLAYHCRELVAAELLSQAHTLGLAVAIANELPPAPLELAISQCFRHPDNTSSLPRDCKPLVVDLSSLWAGPLCSYLLQQAGCRVIKVEGQNRLDGARAGLPDFYRLLNQGKESVVLDFRSSADIGRLKKLIARADIVIEASRPRALRNVGIHAERWAKSQPGLTWLSITGYGRDEVNGNRIGFGDDAAAAAGLSQIMFDATGEYQIVGDAIADPLTGIHAALLAWKSYLAGGNELISISLRDTVSYSLHRELALARESVIASCQQWHRLGNDLSQLFPSEPRAPVTEHAEPGQHNEQVFTELDSVAGTLHQQHHP